MRHLRAFICGNRHRARINGCFTFAGQRGSAPAVERPANLHHAGALVKVAQFNLNGHINRELHIRSDDRPHRPLVVKIHHIQLLRRTRRPEVERTIPDRFPALMSRQVGYVKLVLNRRSLRPRHRNHGGINARCAHAVQVGSFGITPVVKIAANFHILSQRIEGAVINLHPHIHREGDVTRLPHRRAGQHQHPNQASTQYLLHVSLLTLMTSQRPINTQFV